ERARQRGGGEREQDRYPGAEVELRRGDRRRYRHHGADREVYAARRDHQSHADRDEHRRRDLQEDVAEVVHVEKIGREDRVDDQQEQERRERAVGRRVVRDAPAPQAPRLACRRRVRPVPYNPPKVITRAWTKGRFKTATAGTAATEIKFRFQSSNLKFRILKFSVPLCLRWLILMLSNCSRPRLPTRPRRCPRPSRG